jgi:hypothetical protein
VVNERGTIFSTYVGEERRIQCFGGENEEKRPLGEPRRRWEYNIKMGLHSVGNELWTGSSWLS